MLYVGLWKKSLKDGSVLEGVMKDGIMDGRLIMAFHVICRALEEIT